MAKDPAFLFYTGDFSTGTQFLTDEQLGKYMRLLMAQHQHGHLSEKQMMHICKSYDIDVFIKFIKDDNGLYYNERLEMEINKRKKYTESRSNNKSGRKKDVKEDKSYDLHMEDKNKDIIIDIVNYLNKASEKNFKSNSDKTVKAINARLNEKYTIDDFKKVIDVKCLKWKSDQKMADYLRPETLFGTKFESYLNETITTVKKIGRNEFCP